MEAIFHEKQEGALCAQHCLNSLLQGPYFTAVDLASIACELDEAERQTMAEGNVNSAAYLDFMQQPSTNMDDSGYFSIQVLCKALEVWNLEMIPYSSPAAEQTRHNPVDEVGYICNQQNHWLTIRKLGSQWFNLNSIKAYPELISETYLSLLLAQLQTEGYSIFIVSGQLPECEAAQLLEVCAVTQDDYKKFVEDQRAKNVKSTADSRKNSNKLPLDNSQASSPPAPVDPIEVREKRLKYLDKYKYNAVETDKTAEVIEIKKTAEAIAAKKTSAEVDTEKTSQDASNKLDEMTEEEMLRVAVEMSLEPMS